MTEAAAAAAACQVFCAPARCKIILKRFRPHMNDFCLEGLSRSLGRLEKCETGASFVQSGGVAG
jgi:hypothetical protein